MDRMKRRFGAKGQGPRGRGPIDASAAQRGTADGQAEAGAQDESDDECELHVCSWCGRLLAGDFEDEIDGDGPGSDICGDCNRTKNFEAEMS
jgi:hypothetical protein